MENWLNKYEENNWLDSYQDGGQVFNARQKRGIELQIKDYKQQVLDKKELQTKGTLNNPKSIKYKNLAPKKEEIKKHTPQSTSSKAWEVATHPMTAAGYVARNESLPDNFSRGEINAHEIATNLINPFFYADESKNFVKNVVTGHPLDAGINALNVLPLASEYKAIGNLANKAGKVLGEGIDLVHPVGRALSKIEKEGIANGLSTQEIKKLQLEKVGITSTQREGYFPGVSEIVSEYITPYSYENAGARIKDIPRRIIQGEKNSKNLSDVTPDFVFNHEAKKLLSKPRYDAWRMYSGMPQKNNTFRMAETTPLNHPSYSAEELNNLEKFSLNNDEMLLNSLPSEMDLVHLKYGDPEDIVKAVPDLKAELQKIQDIKNKGIEFVPSDFTQTNVMGGYNRRFFDNKMEYNDVWDLNLKGTKVEKYFGKPFLSHGQLDYSFQPAENELNNLIKLGEYHEKNINPYIKSPVEEFYLDTKHFNNQLNPKDLIINQKKKNGGIIKDDDGYWNPNNWGKKVEIDSNNITMEGVYEPLLGISKQTGEQKLMIPGKNYKFANTKQVIESPINNSWLKKYK